MKKASTRVTKDDPVLSAPWEVTEPWEVRKKWNDPLASQEKQQRRRALAQENEELLAKLRARFASEE